jgi:lysophospholipase L1-like esterase
MTLRIVHQNGAIVVFLDGEQVAASDEPSFAGGRIGVWTSQNYAATFDDIVVYDPPAEPVIGIAPVIGGPASPGEYLVKTDGVIDVAAVLNDTALIGGVEFVADEGTPQQIVLPGVLVTNPPFTPYYSASFDPYLVPGNHEITAYALDGALNRIGTAGASDTVSQVGVLGRNLVIFGDSISNGALDNLPGDDISADLRNTSGGYATVLNDAIATAFPAEPVTVIDEATLLDNIGDGVSKIATVLARNPQAQALLVMFGTNDAGVTTPVAFRTDMETIVDAAIAAGLKVFIAKPPPLGPPFAANNPAIALFNAEIDDLIADYALSDPGQVFAGPNFFDDPVADPIPLLDDIHPTGAGYNTMGIRWGEVIIPLITGGAL